ncbi:MAG TPA: tetratricopeptide repeat protein [Chthoniobacterales bacterium]|nr:tetratricopeptide repeat protein [Chthoniobacterales bacterium]
MRTSTRACICCVLVIAASLLVSSGSVTAAPKSRPSATPARATPAKRPPGIVDDSVRIIPAPDLALTTPNVRKADALALFVEGARLEESGEIEAALVAYQKVLTVDPGEVELASRVASLLCQQEDFPRAIDVLKDAIKANPKETAPYLQLAFIYAKHLRKPEQAVKYANDAIALDPENLDAYQRIYEIQVASGDPQKALATLDRAAKLDSRNPNFWARLGKLYASVLFEPDTPPAPEDLRRVNALFKRAADNAGEDAAVLKDVADYFAASQQIHEAIPLYLRVLELEPDDLNAREKLAASFAVTNQREKAIAMLEEIIKQTPEKYQPYDLLAQLLDDEGRALQRAKQMEAAKAAFTKAAANYEQSLLINPNRPQTYLRLAELLLAAVREPERAVRILSEGRMRFRQAPEFAYYLALAQREAKQVQQAVITFEEALQEAEASATEMLNARFFFDYGAAAEQAGLYDKAADLLKRSIALDPARAAEAYNYLGYMWVERNTHLDEAEEMIKKALELDPNNGAYLDSLGWLHYRKGKYDEALSTLLRAAQSLTRDDPVVFEHIGDTYAKLNRIPQALEFWQKASALDAGNKALAEKIESTKTRMSKSEPKGPPMQ